MNQKLNNSIEEFLGNNESSNEKETPKPKVEVLSNKTGLIEVKQIQKKIITEDGRQLLI